MSKIGDTKIAKLEKIGEDTIFDRIANGESVNSLCREYEVGLRIFYRFLRKADGRADRYQDALKLAGHAYAARAVETAQGVDDPALVNMARLKVDTDKWMAGKLNQDYDVRQRETTVTLRIEDLHAQVAELVGDEVVGAVLEGDYEELEAWEEGEE